MGRIANYLCISMAVIGLSAGWAHAQPSLEQAWEALPHYEYGQDLAGQLAIERSVIEAMQTPQRRAEIAARCARLLSQPDTTLAAKQFLCLQLRQVGTAAEVPQLAQLLPAPDTWQMALLAIAAIPGPESLAALRTALDQLQGAALVGAIHALGARQDSGCVPRLIQLAAAPDELVAHAALRALANIADEQALAWLQSQADQQKPWSDVWAQCLVRVAAARAHQGQRAEAAALWTQLSDAQQQPATRRAALEGLLRLDPAAAADTIRSWFVGNDPLAQQVAAAHLSELPDATLEELSRQVASLPETSAVVLIEVLASRRSQHVLPFLLEMVNSDVPAVQLAGLRCLGALHDPSTIPTLIDRLAADEQVAAVAQQALARMPRDVVGPAILAALDRPDIRGAVISVLKELKYYEAIDPLIAIAAQPDPAANAPALDGLRSIADPDEYDIPRLMQLLYQTQPGTHRDEVEKTIAIVCDKQPADQDRAAPVLQAWDSADDAHKLLSLPLLGRLGGARARQIIESHLDASDKNAQEAAVRALCNWPDAGVADQLLNVAGHARDKRHARWALRAFVRVITLPSDRAPDATLAQLQQIMQQAHETEDRALIISRAATVRTLDCVRWVAEYLDDPALAQPACATIVDLAHHRELRHPNMDTIGPILDKVAATSSDAAVVERAKRYRLGL